MVRAGMRNAKTGASAGGFVHAPAYSAVWLTVLRALLARAQVAATALFFDGRGYTSYN